MMLSDHEIRDLCIDKNGIPFEDAMISPFSEAVSGNGIISYGLTSAGYDLRLGTDIWIMKNTYGDVVSPKRIKDEAYINRIYDRMTISGVFVLPPHSYILGKTHEWLNIPRGLKGSCTGKSTLARVGIVVNTTPMEPAWKGFLTIEIANTSPCSVEIYQGEGIAQLELTMLHTPCEISYADKGGKYQNQQGVVPALVK